MKAVSLLMIDSFHTIKMNILGFLLLFSASLQQVYGTQPSQEILAEERSYQKEKVYTLYDTGFGNSNQGYTDFDSGYSNFDSGHSNINSGHSNLVVVQDSHSNSGYSNSRPGYIKSFTKFMSKLAAKGKKWRKKYQNYRDNYRSNEITYVIPLPHPHPPHPPLRPPLPFPLWFREQQKKSKFPANPEKDTFKVHHESSHVDINKGAVITKVICEKCMNYGPNHEAFPKKIPGKIISQSPKHIEFLSKGGKTDDGFEALRSKTIIGTFHSPEIIDTNYHKSN